jgi:hypothetical protein
MSTIRNARNRLEALEERHAVTDERIEFCVGYGIMYAPEPQLTEYLASLGFMVEREERVFENGNQDVMLRTTPSLSDFFGFLQWYSEGTTTDPDNARILWYDDGLDAVVTDAEHPVVYEEPTLPGCGPEFDDPESLSDLTVVGGGEGWDLGVHPECHVWEMILPRSEATRYGFEILNDVPSWIPIPTGLDLVVVDFEPLPYPLHRAVAPTPPPSGVSPIRGPNGESFYPEYDNRIEYLKKQREEKRRT